MTDDKPKFTPGPWEVRDRTIGGFRFLTVVNDASPMVIIAKIPSLHELPFREWKNAYDIDEVAANAALIAAAPEMYYMLCNILNDLETGEYISIADNTAFDIRGLLAKARKYY